MPEFHARELSAWTRGRWTGEVKDPIKGISIDSRTIKTGEIYVALKGDRLDGHQFVDQAFDRGAIAAMVEEGYTAPKASSRLLLRVPNSRRALLDMAEGYRQQLTTEMIAITGSVGKTTVKEMIADILATRASTARTLGNWNNDIGLPLSLLNVKPSDQFGAFEVGMNHAGELEPLCRLLRPICGVVTSVGPVHLEFFNSVEDIAKEKSSVFRVLPPHGVAVLSRDEKYFELLKAAAPCKVITTSLRGEADFIGTPSASGSGRFTVTETDGGRNVEFDTSLPGDYVVQDALLAIAVGRSFGVTWDAMVGAIKKFRPLPLRWQQEQWHGVEFINDAYNANPLSMRAALQAFSRTSTDGRRWLVLAGMKELGASESNEHLALGREVAKGSWAGLIAVGPLGERIAEGAEAAGCPASRLIRSKDVKAAAQALKERLRRGDAVLLKASRSEHLEDVLKEWVRLQKKEGAGCAC